MARSRSISSVVGSSTVSLAELCSLKRRPAMGTHPPPMGGGAGDESGEGGDGGDGNGLEHWPFRDGSHWQRPRPEYQRHPLHIQSSASTGHFVPSRILGGLPVYQLSGQNISISPPKRWRRDVGLEGLACVLTVCARLITSGVNNGVIPVAAVFWACLFGAMLRLGSAGLVCRRGRGGWELPCGP